MNAQADADPETLRISMDTKATVDVGEYSRYGRSRGLEPVKVWATIERGSKVTRMGPDKMI